MTTHPTAPADPLFPGTANGSDGDTAPRHMDVSIVVPLYNEEDNVAPLLEELIDVMSDSALAWEAILVNDGSTDGTAERLRECAAHDRRIHVIELTKNFGQTAALAAGFSYATGSVVVPMDGDQQNDPRDIPLLVAKLDEAPGWDIVSGWRKRRQDKLWSRRLPSILANHLIKKLTWTGEIHDFGCMLKAYRREVLDDVRLYGEMHRFLPAICKWRGARVTEVVVNHRPRVLGTSKYGLRRTIKVLLDLLTVKFIGDYLTKPIYFFGKLTMAATGVAVLSLAFAIAQKFGYLGEPVKLNNNVLLFFSMMLMLMSVMFLMMGVLSELLVRIYHESQARTPYKIRHTILNGNGARGALNARTSYGSAAARRAPGRDASPISGVPSD